MELGGWFLSCAMHASTHFCSRQTHDVFSAAEAMQAGLQFSELQYPALFPRKKCAKPQAHSPSEKAVL
jgi:hypothetical protein